MTTYSRPFLISQKGSTRATAYVCGNKSITRGGITYVAWLDAVSKVKFRAYDHNSKRWGETQPVDTGADNHANPAMTVNAGGHISMAFGPHGCFADWNQARFRHVISENSVDGTPGIVGRWMHHHYFGYAATYASLVNTHAGLDCIVYRGGESPYSLLFQRQRIQGGWTSARELVCQDIEPQYTQYLAILACDSGDTLYTAGHVYHNKDMDGVSEGIVLLRSEDLGETWSSICGKPARLPVRIEQGFAVPNSHGTRIGGMCVDNRKRLWVLPGPVSKTGRKKEIFLHRWDGGDWKSLEISRFMPDDRVPEAGNMVVDAGGRIHVVASMKHVDAPAENWSDPSREVFHLQSDDDGRTFSCTQISDSDPGQCNWLPTISQSGPHHPVDNPVILYTRGMQGEGCAPPTHTDVYCVFVSNT